MGLACIERLDRDTIRCPRGQALERPALEHAGGESNPLLARCGRKLGGKGQVVAHAIYFAGEIGHTDCMCSFYHARYRGRHTTIVIVARRRATGGTLANEFWIKG